MEIETTFKHPHGAQHRSRRRDDLGALVATQHGVVAHGQLVALGFSRREVQGMKKAGWMHPVHRGVYAVGRRSLGRNGRWMAAVLACGPGALLSHRSAGALHGLLRTRSSVIEVTVPTARGRDIAGVRPYVARRLEPHDSTVVHGIPCTSVALTLLNIAAVTPRRQTERACDEAEVQRLVHLQQLHELLERSRGRRGVATLRAVLADHAIGTTLTRSELEELTLAICRRAEVPVPAVNADAQGASGRTYSVDFLWPDHRVVLETDGHAYHRTRSAVERDRRREADLVTAGLRVLRSTWRQVAREPDGIGRMLRAALEVQPQRVVSPPERVSSSFLRRANRPGDMPPGR
jgi:predicted transcriptional regulator of viral defense system